MEKIKLYALLDKSSDTISNVYMSGDDISAVGFMVESLKEINNNITSNLKSDFLARTQDSAVVRIGTIDLQTKKLESDFNLVADFFDFKFEELEKEKDDE